MASLTATHVAINRLKQSITVSGLEFKSLDTFLSAEITGDTINGKPSVKGTVTIAPFNPTKILKQLSITSPDIQDAKALSKASVTFDLLASIDSINLQNILLTLDDSQITGSINMTGFNKPTFTANLTADTIDIDRYLPPVTDKSSKTAASPGITLAFGAYALQADKLIRLNINSQLSLGRLKINGMTMQDVKLNLNAKEGLINVQQTANKFYDGSYSNSFCLDVRNEQPKLVLNEQISHIQIEPFLNDFSGESKMSGLIDASAQFEGLGSNTKELKTSLSGNISFLIIDTAIKGFNLQNIIDDPKALIKKPVLVINNKNEQTLFSKISGTATINNGQIQNNDLTADSSKIHLEGKGNANLNTEKLDYKINAAPIKTKSIPSDTVALNDTAINISIGGTFSQPTYTLDLVALLTDKNKAKIEQFIDKHQSKINEIANKIDRKIGPKIDNLLKGLFKKNKE